MMAKLRVSKSDLSGGSEAPNETTFLPHISYLFSMRWIAKPQQETMEQVMSGQADVLHEQIVSTSMLADVEPFDDQPMPPMPGPMMGRGFMHNRLRF